MVAAIAGLDAMCKAADVRLIHVEKRLGGRLVTVVVEGTVSAVEAAAAAGAAAWFFLIFKKRTNTAPTEAPAPENEGDVAPEENTEPAEAPAEAEATPDEAEKPTEGDAE